MPNKVYLVVAASSVDTNLSICDAYYVRAANPVDAEQKVNDAINRYYFKVKLADQSDVKQPKTLGDNVIVEGFISDAFPAVKHRVTDITDIAYLWTREGQPYFVDWNITLEDVNA